ncbi:MAG: hypothetical protein K2N58_07630 [Treponemataceae bacterium]|nr:hypothetical protein [Treponemataceae bacterium]
MRQYWNESVDYDSGETYFTKNMSFSVVNGFIENAGGLKIKKIEHPCNMFFLNAKNSNGTDRWYVDLVYDEEAGKVIGVGKLFREKDEHYEYYNSGVDSEMKEKVFKEPEGASMFRVERKKELILINFRTRFYRSDTPKELIEQIQFHIANIPEVLKGLDFVFRAPLGRGEVYDINANGDKISLFSDTERSLREVNIATYINENEIDKILEFNLEHFDFPVNGAERAYTPAMLWLTRRMNEIYEEWQKGQQKAGRCKD